MLRTPADLPETEKKHDIFSYLGNRGHKHDISTMLPSLKLDTTTHKEHVFDKVSTLQHGRYNTSQMHVGRNMRGLNNIQDRLGYIMLGRLGWVRLFASYSSYV